MSDLATLNFAKYTHGSTTERLQFAQDLAESFKKHGFVKIINHGVPEEEVEAIFDWSDRFFQLPLPSKKTMQQERTPNPQRGYLSYGEEKTSYLTSLHKDVKQPHEGKGNKELTDQRESFDVGPIEDSEYPNVWPNDSELPGFRVFVEAYFERCRKISLQLVEATALGLSIPPEAMLDRCVPDRSELRFNYYPEASLKTLKSGLSQRIWPHTDFGVITLLFQDGVGGLELEDRLNGRRFVPVKRSLPGGPSELIVNTADCMQRWTNNVIRAGLHQVSVPEEMRQTESGVVPKRFSCPFFLKSRYDGSVGPLPYFVSEKNPAQYDEITAVQYHRQRVEKLFIEKPKIALLTGSAVKVTVDPPAVATAA